MSKILWRPEQDPVPRTPTPKAEPRPAGSVTINSLTVALLWAIASKAGIAEAEVLPQHEKLRNRTGLDHSLMGRRARDWTNRHCRWNRLDGEWAKSAHRCAKTKGHSAQSEERGGVTT